MYDKDLIFDDKIGSVKIYLQDLYQKGFQINDLFFFEKTVVFVLLGHIDNWYNLLSSFGISSHGQIHVILDYQPLKL